MEIENQEQQAQENEEVQDVQTEETTVETVSEDVPDIVKQKTPDEIEADIKASFKQDFNLQDDEVEFEQVVEAEQGQEEAKVEQTNDYKYNPAWDVIKSEYEEQFGEGSFKMPEGITPETDHKMLLDFLTENLQPSQSLDNIPDAAREIIELSKEGKFDEKQWIENRKKQTNLTSLSDEELLTQVYKNDGYDEEDIRDHLKKMTNLEKKAQAKDLRGRIEQIEREKQAKDREFLETNKIKQLQNINQEKVTLAQKVVQANKQRDEFLGVQMSKAQIDEFNKVFPEMVKIDPKTGTSPLYDMLQSDELLYEIAGLLHAGGKNIIKNKVTEAKKQVKEEIERKLGVKADIKANAQERGNVQLFDRKRFLGQEDE